MSVAVDWANCTGVPDIAGSLYKTVNGLPAVCGNYVYDKSKGLPNAIGSHTWNVDTKQQSNTVVTSAVVFAADNVNKVQLAQSPPNNLNVVIP